MKSRWSSLFWLCLAIGMGGGGCAMCDNSFDDAYNAYGGIAPRHDQFHGRVGSILSDPAVQYLPPDHRDTAPTEADLYHAELQSGS